MSSIRQVGAAACLVLMVHCGLDAAELPDLAVFNTEVSTHGPMSVPEVLSKTEVPPGFRMKLFASEPDVRQPIAMATDTRGRLWVAENNTYSERAVGYHPQLRDRILVFEGSDRSGRFLKRSVFWDRAERLTSIETGLGGVWALCLPNLVFIPDANEDDVPDGPPQIVLDGFEFQAARHTVANGLRWGPDGWLYGRQGILGVSRVGAPGTPPEQRTTLNTGIWRYHPGRRVFEVVAQGTTNPWGMDWDAHGNGFFINTVIGHLWQVIPGAHYRRMFGDDSDPHVYELIDQHADHVHWATGEVWTDVRKGVTDATLAAGGGHAHTGLLIYQGGQWPSFWDGKLLTINFHGRRLNVEQLDREGSGFVGRHTPDAFKFADPWFRGIDLLAAPDGGVFVSDWSDTGECHDHDGIHRTSGRLFKIEFAAAQSGAPILDLRTLKDDALARIQSHPNDWMTRQARRVLADRVRQGRSIEAGRAVLRELTLTDPNEVTRLRAMWALHVSGGVELGLLRKKLEGTASERGWALTLWEEGRHEHPKLGEAFARFLETDLERIAASESFAQVRLVMASLLQKIGIEQRAGLARGLLRHAEDAEDHNLPLMIWYGIEPLAETHARFIDLIVEARLPRVQRLGARRIAEEIDRKPGRVDDLLSALARAKTMAVSSRLAILNGLADGFAGRRRVARPASWSAVEKNLGEGAEESLKNRIQDLSALFGDGRALDRIKAVALDGSADVPRRRAALRTLVEARADGLRPLCEQLLPIRDLSGTAASGLALFDDPAIADRLIGEWPHLYGHERSPVMNALLSRSAWAGRLLAAMESGTFRRSDLGAAQARQLRDFKDDALSRKLAEVWGTLQESEAPAREAAMEAWKRKLTPEVLSRADLTEGEALYAKTCGACHKLFGAGGTLGPDLTGAGRQSLDYVLENILFPSAVVPADYRQVTFSLKDGRALSGVVRRRAERTVVLEMIGESATLDRSEIEREEVSNLSIMPEGILDPLTVQQAADLIAFLMSPSPPTKPAK